MKDSPSVHRTWRWSGWRPGLLLRVALAGVIIIACSATASATYLNHQVTRLASDLSAAPKLHIAKGVLAPTPYGGAETILLVGNDQRNHTTTNPVLPHSNEMLLVRLDPSKPWISMMSLPRELDVPIDTSQYGVVHTRLNASLMFGGIPLLVSTIKQVTGLSVNHVIVIDFNNFKRAIDELGCAYGTIDRRYLHINTPYDQQYQQINLQPGYQRLCGDAALSFVSYRHGDTSLIRDARDQEFLLEAKQEYGPTLLSHLSEFERIFGQTVQTDPGLRTSTGLLSLLGTMVAEQGKPVRQVQFQATLLSTVDTATQQQISASVHSFLYGTDQVPRRGVAGAAATLHRGHAVAALLQRTPASELSAMHPLAARSPLTVMYPRVQTAAAAGGPIQVGGCSGIAEPNVCMRSYRIDGPHRTYPAYVVVTAQGGLDQYYDVQGTTWTTAPMFNDPEQFVHVGGREYALYYSGAHLDVVAWWQGGAVYWVHNTIIDSLDNREMLDIAESATPLAAPAVAVMRGGHRTKVTRDPAPTAPPSTIVQRASTASLVSALLAGLALVLAALTVVGILVQRRRAITARHALEATHRASLAVLAGLYEAAETSGSGSSVSSPRSES